MDSDYLIHDLDYIAVNGVAFTIEERSMLHNSLTLLKQDGKFAKVYFWGKIFAIEGSYYIAFGVLKDILRQRQVFYSKEMKRWNLLTPPTPLHLQFHAYLRRPLTGDAAFEQEVSDPIYFIDEEEPEQEESSIQSEESEEMEEEGEDEFEESVKIGTKRQSIKTLPGADSVDTTEDEEDREPTTITEEERLSCIVAQITAESALAPRGAYVRTPVGEVLNNRFFTGLNSSDAPKAQNYVHVRFPKNALSKARGQNSEVARSVDFLDVIADDMPRGCWSIQVDTTRDVVIIRSLWWPGMVFYHRINSRDFGFLYVGTGEKCIDLPFML